MSTPVTGSRTRRWRRIAIGVLVGLACVEVAWIILVNGYLSSGAALARLGRNPGRMSVTWSRARSWYPGHVAVQGLDVSGGSRVSEWHVTCDAGSFRVGLLPLLFKRVAVRDADMGRVAVRVRSRPRPDADPAVMASWPPIPGKPERPEPRPAPRAKPRKLWDVDVDDAAVADLAEVWVNAVRIEEGGRLRAAARIRPRRWFSLPSVEWRSTAARLSVGGVPLMSALDMDAETRFGRWPYREERGRAGLAHLSGRFALSGDDLSLDFLRWLRFDEITPRLDGPGRLEMTGRLEDGRLLEGTTATLTADRCGVQVLRLDVGGRVAVQAKVVREEGNDVLRAVASFADIEVRRSGAPQTAATGASATIELAWQDPTLVADEPIRTVIVDCPALTVPDVALLNPMLPAGSRLGFVEGSAAAALRLELHDGRSGRAHLDLEARDVRMDLPGGTRCRGNVEFLTDAQLEDVRAGRASYDGTRLHITDVVLEDRDAGPPWSLQVEAVRGRMDVEKGEMADADLAFRMTDLRPIKAAAGEGAPAWLRLVPNVADLEGTTHLRVRENLVELDRCAVSGRDFELLMNLRLEESRADGLVFARWKVFRVGVELRDGRRDWKLTRAREWFVQRTGWTPPVVP